MWHNNGSLAPQKGRNPFMWHNNGSLAPQKGIYPFMWHNNASLMACEIKSSIYVAH